MLRSGASFPTGEPGGLRPGTRTGVPPASRTRSLSDLLLARAVNALPTRDTDPTRNRRSLRTSTPRSPCARTGRSRTFFLHRARSSFSPPPRVQRPALRGLRGTRGASDEAATGSVPRFPGRDGHQLPPDGRSRLAPRAVSRHLRHARPLRRGRPSRRPRGDDARRRGAGRRRLRAARRRPGAGDRDPPPVRAPDARDGHGGARVVLRAQGLRLRGAGRARQVLVRRRLRPGRGRDRGRLRHGRVDRHRRLVQRPRRAVGRVVLRVHVAGRRDQRPSRRRRHRARRHRHRLARRLVPGRRAAAEHRRVLGDRDGRPGVRRPDARRSVAPAAGGHGRGGRRLGRVLPRHDRPRRRRGVVARAQPAPPARRRARAGADLVGVVRQLHRRAAARPAADAGDAPGAGDRAPDGRAVGPRGQRRAHRPRRLRAGAADRGAPLGRLPGLLRPLRDAGRRRGAGAGGRGVHAQRRLAAPGRVAAAGRDADRLPPAGGRRPVGRSACGGRGARRVRLRPGGSDPGDARAATAGCCARRSATVASSSGGRTW